MESNYLYHYTKLETALESILPKMQLRLGPLSKTNDPRENKSFVFAAKFWGPNIIQDIEAQNSINSNILRRDCKVICFSRMPKHFWGFEYSKMWAHYGGSHKGICFQISKKEFISENRKFIKPRMFKNVRYIDFNINKMQKHKEVEYPTEKDGLENYLKNEFRERHLDYLYFRKTKEWSSEREARLLYFSDSLEDEYCSIKNSLSAIYIGLDFNKCYLPSIFSLSNQIPIYELRYNDDRILPLKIEKPFDSK
jgi:hypothetical protein